MSTRCYICKEYTAINGTKKYRGVYCHHDGYYEHVGDTLITHYRTEQEVDMLLALGDLSSLSDSPYLCCAYVRDMGRDWEENCGFDYTEAELFSEAACYIEYIYLYRDNCWYMADRKKNGDSFEMIGGPYDDVGKVAKDKKIIYEEKPFASENNEYGEVPIRLFSELTPHKLDYPAKTATWNGKEIEEYIIPDADKEKVLKRVYPFLPVPDMTETITDIVASKDFRVCDFRVIRIDDFVQIMSPYFDSNSQGDVSTWFPMDGEDRRTQLTMLEGQYSKVGAKDADSCLRLGTNLHWENKGEPAESMVQAYMDGYSESLYYTHINKVGSIRDSEMPF